MAAPDSLFSKRTAPKKRLNAGIGSLPDPLSKYASDIMGGFSELKRQSGAAVQNIKAGYQRIKQAIKP